MHVSLLKMHFNMQPLISGTCQLYIHVGKNAVNTFSALFSGNFSTVRPSVRPETSAFSTPQKSSDLGTGLPQPLGGYPCWGLHRGARPARRGKGVCDACAKRNPCAEEREEEKVKW